MTRQMKIKLLTANCRCGGNARDTAAFNSMSEDTLDLLLANTPGASGNPSQDDGPVGGAEDDEGDYDGDTDEEFANEAEGLDGRKGPKPYRDKGGKGAPRENRERVGNANGSYGNARPTFTQMLGRYGTPYEREAWATTVAHMRQVRAAKIQKLVGNHAEPGARKEAWAIYGKMTNDQLTALVNALPVDNSFAKEIEDRERGTGRYPAEGGVDPMFTALAANAITGGGTGMTTEEDRNDGLPLPTINYREAALAGAR